MALDNASAGTPRATSLATNLQEFKAAKAAPAAVTTPTPEEKKPDSSEPTGKPGSGTAAAPEAPNQETQEPGKPKRGSAESRAAELSAQGRYDEARKILEAKDRKRDEEIAELRKKLETPQAPSKPAAEPEPKTPVSDGKPKLKDLLARPENKDKAYDDVVEEWEEAKYEWRTKTERAEAESKKHANTVSEKIAEGRAKHGADFDAALRIQLHNGSLQALVNDFDNGMDVLMALHEDPAEHQRIFALSPARQLVELGYIARDLMAEAKTKAPNPEKPKLPTPISRSSPPPRNLGGIAPGEPSDKDTPKTHDEHKRRKAAGAK